MMRRGRRYFVRPLSSSPDGCSFLSRSRTLRRPTPAMSSHHGLAVQRLAGLDELDGHTGFGWMWWTCQVSSKARRLPADPLRTGCAKPHTPRAFSSLSLAPMTTPEPHRNRYQPHRGALRLPRVALAACDGGARSPGGDLLAEKSPAGEREPEPIQPRRMSKTPSLRWRSSSRPSGRSASPTNCASAG